MAYGVSTELPNLLRPTAVGFAGAVLLHNADHARRGGSSLTTDLFAAGTAAMLVEVAIVVLIFQRHRLASVAASAAGFSLAVGYVFAHVLPQRGWLSDPLFTERADPLSQTAAIVEIVAALALGGAGTLASRGADAGATAHSRPLTDVLREPVVAVFTLGNVIILIISLLDR